MKTECEVIRDLLPLYADDVCSDGSKKLVEEHLPECPDCSALLESLRRQEIEKGLQEEKDQVIKYQAKRFRRRSATVGSVVSGLFMIPVLVCLIVNLASGSPLGWFFIVLAGLAVAASLVIVPLMMPENRMSICVPRVIDALRCRTTVSEHSDSMKKSGISNADGLI